MDVSKLQSDWDKFEQAGKHTGALAATDFQDQLAGGISTLANQIAAERGIEPSAGRGR